MTPRTPQSSTISGPYTLFALATKLLAFFVMLYAVMERDPARQHDVSDSLAHRRSAGPGPVALVPLDGNLPAVKVMERRWLDLFPGVGMVDGGTFGYGHVLRAELALGSVFAQGRADPLPGAPQAVGPLVKLVAGAPKGLDLALDIKLGVALGIDAADERIAIQRAGALSKLLSTIDHGGGEIAVGLQHGNPTAIVLELRIANRPVREAVMPALTALPRSPRDGA